MRPEALNLHERTALLESLEWDEEALIEMIQDCEQGFSKFLNEKGDPMLKLSSYLAGKWGEESAKLCITYYVRCSVSQKEEPEA